MIENLPGTSKLWIFQNNKKFTSDEESFITSELFSFISSWQAHGKNLHPQFEIKYNLFIIVAVNEELEKASGCSIDSLVLKIRQVQDVLSLNLLDKSLIGYTSNSDLNKIHILPLLEFKKKIKKKELSENTLVFNNAVSTVKEYSTNWIQPLENSWAKVFLK